MKSSILLSVFLCLLGFMSCSSPSASSGSDTTNVKPFSDVAPSAWKEEAAKNNGIILDVRTPAEVAAGKIPNSIAIDISATDFQTKIKALDTTKPVYVYCASGGRSGRAMQLMKSLGFTAVYNLQGGITAWKSEGYKVE